MKEEADILGMWRGQKAHNYLACNPNDIKRESRRIEFQMFLSQTLASILGRIPDFCKDLCQKRQRCCFN